MDQGEVGGRLPGQSCCAHVRQPGVTAGERVDEEDDGEVGERGRGLDDPRQPVPGDAQRHQQDDADQAGGGVEEQRALERHPGEQRTEEAEHRRPHERGDAPQQSLALEGIVGATQAAAQVSDQLEH